MSHFFHDVFLLLFFVFVLLILSEILYIYMDTNTDSFTPPVLRMRDNKDGTKEAAYPNTQNSEPLTNKMSVIFMSV